VDTTDLIQRGITCVSPSSYVETGAKAEAVVPYEVFEGDEGLARLRDPWRSMELRSADHVFQTFDYAQRWQDTIGRPSGATPLIVALIEHGEIVALFPTCRQRLRGVPVLTWLGGPRILDYGDVVFDADSAETPIDRFVGDSLALLRKHARGAPLYLTNVRDDAQAIGPLLGGLRVLRYSAAPYLEVQGTYEQLLASLTRNMRGSLKRCDRRLAEAGQVECHVFAPGDPGIQAAMEFMVAEQRARFADGLGRTDLFDENHVRYRMEQATNDPHSRVTVLSLDGTTIAASMTVIYRHRMYALMNCFDPDYSQYSPGRALHAADIRSCFEHGWSPYDFCWGDEAHKYTWTSLDTRLTTFVTNDAAGALASAIVTSKRRVGRALENRRKGRTQ
jgi:CelD/BcsL family acetyltransferase involved in cellulose biosynthesis